MGGEDHLKSWLEDNCPNLWSLLNEEARKVLPQGLREYLSPPSALYLDQIREKFPEFDQEYLDQIAESRAAQGKENLVLADQPIKELIASCGSKTVGDTYRRDLSGVGSEKQLAELLCEITLCVAISKLSTPPPHLRPQSGKGTYCDVSFQLAGSTVYGEAKRYEDTWFSDLDPKRPDKRSLVKASPGTKPQGSTRPRAMDLVSKLRDVPRQFPQKTVNLIFIFHSSIGDSHRYLQQALFGDGAFFDDPANVNLTDDGLFATEEWRAISGCCLSRVLPDSALVCPVIWGNPRAFVPLPAAVRAALDCLKSYDVLLEEV